MHLFKKVVFLFLLTNIYITNNYAAQSNIVCLEKLPRSSIVGSAMTPKGWENQTHAYLYQDLYRTHVKVDVPGRKVTCYYGRQRVMPGKRCPGSCATYDFLARVIPFPSGMYCGSFKVSVNRSECFTMKSTRRFN